MPFFYEENYEKMCLDLEKTIKRSKQKINGDVTVTASYDTGTAIGFNTKFIKAFRINGVDIPISY